MAIGRVPFGILVVFGVFLAIVAYLLAGALVRRNLPTFEPSLIAPQRSHATSPVSDTVTVDARDPSVWRYFDFERGSIVLAPDTAGWDLGFRRYQIIAGAGIADVGEVVFDSVRQAPRGGYVPNQIGADTINPAVDRWYDYSFVSHLLEPKERVYVVRTAEDTYAKFEILSYYCTGLASGCFTFRYRFPIQREGQ